MTTRRTIALTPIGEQLLVLSIVIAAGGILYAGLGVAADRLDRVLARRELMRAWRRVGRWR